MAARMHGMVVKKKSSTSFSWSADRRLS